MKRKSFDIHEDDLAQAKLQAQAMNISLFRYMQLAIKEKNEGTSSLALMQEMEARLVKQMSQMRLELDRVRLDIKDDNDQLAELLREQNQHLLETTDAQIRGFIKKLGDVLDDDTPEPQPWSPGSNGIPSTY